MSVAWFKSQQKLPELHTRQEFEDLLQKDLVILFKHSVACDRSRSAHSELKRFQAAQPEALVYLVHVLANRSLSQYIAEHTGVEHASPQVLVMRHGKVIASASHGNVSADVIEAFISAD